MAKPTCGDWGMFKVRRVLELHHCVVHRYPRIMKTEAVPRFTGASWAWGPAVAQTYFRRSLTLGLHWVKSWGQSSGADGPSPAESELYASVKAIADSLATQAMETGLWLPFGGVIVGDVPAASGIIDRCGRGTARHVDTNRLWIQRAGAQKRATFDKFSGTAK